jgi:hypothetical protein
MSNEYIFRLTTRLKENIFCTILIEDNCCIEEYQPLELHNLILSCVSKGTPGNIGKLPLEWLDICLASKREIMSYVKNNAH